MAHAWEPGYFRLFIRHIAERKDVAAALRDSLRAHRVDAFVAHEDIAPTADWQDELEDIMSEHVGEAKGHRRGVSRDNSPLRRTPAAWPSFADCQGAPDENKGGSHAGRPSSIRRDSHG